jgi:hypothetical protein
MIISPSRRFVFVHPPKTGGTAISLAYEARAKSDDLLFGDTPKARKRQGNHNRKNPNAKLSKHSTLSLADSHLPDFDLTDFNVAMTVRNPWDRIVSFYSWAKAQEFDHPMIAAAKSQDFADFLRDERLQRPFQRVPTHLYAAPVTATLLRQERLEHDWHDLCAKIDLPKLSLPRTNQSKRARDWRPFYTDETAALIPEILPWEVHELGYGFDP